MAAWSVAAGDGRRPVQVAAVLQRRPTLVVSAAIGVGWASAAAFAHAAHHHGLPARVALWAVMCVAMMVPSALPAIEHVERNSLAWRRGRAVSCFLAVYLGIWTAYGAVVLALSGLLPAGAATLAAALALAACWELVPLKLRALRACHASVPLRARGWRATASVLRFGSRNAAACLGSCWALMLVMGVVGSAHVVWMAGLAAIVCAQKLLAGQRRTTRLSAAALAAAAAIVLLAG